ncbi:MAG TPA: hypothetical protein VGF32_31060 [Streptosporangiaceae bacterium]|jgi:hypothetical protein
MPELEYVVLADYVRQDAGVTHIMGAGIDTFAVPTVPAAVMAGIVVRLAFSSRDHVGAEHEAKFVFSGPPGDLLTLAQHFPTPPPAPGVPEHWRTALNLVAPRLVLPIPVHGNYRLTVSIDDDPRLSRGVDVRAIAPEPGQT